MPHHSTEKSLCNEILGCEWNKNAPKDANGFQWGCNGTPTPCEEFTNDENKCLSQKGCQWEYVKYPVVPSFTTGVNHSKCNAWRDCKLGTYVKTIGTRFENRNCAGCPLGRFSHHMNMRVLRTGKHRNCSLRKVGNVLVEPKCTLSHEDIYECYEWKTCLAPLEYMERNGSSQEDRQCGTCPENHFSTEDNHTSCEPRVSFANSSIPLERAPSFSNAGGFIVSPDDVTGWGKTVTVGNFGFHQSDSGAFLVDHLERPTVPPTSFTNVTKIWEERDCVDHVLQKGDRLVEVNGVPLGSRSFSL